MIPRHSTVETERALLQALGRLRRAASLRQMRLRQRAERRVRLQVVDPVGPPPATAILGIRERQAA